MMKKIGKKNLSKKRQSEQKQQLSFGTWAINKMLLKNSLLLGNFFNTFNL